MIPNKTVAAQLGRQFKRRAMEPADFEVCWGLFHNQQDLNKFSWSLQHRKPAELILEAYTGFKMNSVVYEPFPDGRVAHLFVSGQKSAVDSFTVLAETAGAFVLQEFEDQAGLPMRSRHWAQR